MEKQSSLDYLKWIPAILIMVTIFLLSHAPGSTSSQMSEVVTDVIMRVIDKVFGKSEFVGLLMSYIIVAAELLVRKFAHITEYAALAFACCYAYDNEKRKRVGLVVILFCFCYAMTDEFHQLFIVGRSGQFSDVLIDMCGVLIGASIYMTRDAAKWLCEQIIKLGISSYVLILLVGYPLYQGEKYDFLKMLSIPIFCILVGLWIVYVVSRRWSENKVSIRNITVTDCLVCGYGIWVSSVFTFSYFEMYFIEYHFPYKELMIQLLFVLIYIFVSRFIVTNSKFVLFLILAVVVTHFLLMQEAFSQHSEEWYRVYLEGVFSNTFLYEHIMHYGMIGCILYLCVFLSQGISCIRRYKDIICIGVIACVIVYLVQYFKYGQHIVTTPFIFIMMGIGERRIRISKETKGIG